MFHTFFLSGALHVSISTSRALCGDRCHKHAEKPEPSSTTYYEIDGDTSEHALTLDAYGGDGVGSWVLLEESEESE